ncbi:MAG: FkbM family methyltransferase [Chthoniobacterales bacterium]
MIPLKSTPDDILGRFREVISDPLNLLIHKVPLAGVVEKNEVYLHNGNIVPFDGAGAYYGKFSELLVLNRGVHEPLEEYVFQELLKNLPETPLMIELGAYWGHYSMWLKKLRPKSTTILVEPDPANFLSGVRNFDRNGYEGEFIESFVGHGQLEIDKFLSSRSMDHLDILHADIQGYEAQMLEGCQNSLKGCRIDHLFISTHSQELHTKIVSEIERVGYVLEVSSDFDNETTSYDGFVFASSPCAKKLFEGFAPLGRTSIVESVPDRLLATLLEVKHATI